MLKQLRRGLLPGRRHVFAHGERSISGLRVLFFGTDNVSLPTLELLHAHMQSTSDAPPLVREIEVICPPDRKMARKRTKAPVPVKQFALENNLAVHHIPDGVKSLKDWTMPVTKDFDVGVVVSFGYFLHPHMLEHVKHGAINMHPSLLPKYRGPAPIPRTLWHGDAVTGVSVIEIDPTAFDVGRILDQTTMDVPPASTFHSLSDVLARAGAQRVIATLRDLPAKKASAIVQDEALATKAPKMKREHGLVAWTETAQRLYCMWQAVGETFGVLASFQGVPVKLLEMRLPTLDDRASLAAVETFSLPTGACYFDKGLQALVVKCVDDVVLVTKLQAENRNPGRAIDFANGHRMKPRAVHSFDLP
ncbi:methionyl-tRNA formyltransferase [Saprolegnia parasitica CBS 223.65]|uniref:Methionyl-tRNA formyltransferase, mitochondrial n=1 Tax=Saprolegnia parasitica (strain CBS 223.65) TaxID=695850 RepID=A0A067CX52_SAPPC|nr:methionyl-tRNA formyltransferase [Saprolegnia parasitica CBS 223.65]KDO35264.1 methionyl-tRNA formyltransferase [Saprolegnia parasitica CBS 223.65]|eukprot:XP_012193615.1 methionyl-tRNA formyltransferase [Saprolegnia parasitica CBS 223.65]